MCLGDSHNYQYFIIFSIFSNDKRQKFYIFEMWSGKVSTIGILYFNKHSENLPCIQQFFIHFLIVYSKYLYVKVFVKFGNILKKIEL